MTVLVFLQYRTEGITKHGYILFFVSVDDKYNGYANCAG